MTFLGAAILIGALFAVLWPMLADFSTYGFHDWDVVLAYRYITVLSLKEYGEGPWWHPFLCGGIPAFGNVETATNLVSPYLPLYLALDIRSALRLEVLGGGLLGLSGAWLLAGRFTCSVALRTLFALLYVLNGRWALQVAVGHTWHLQYALTPWVFYFFDRAHGDRQPKLTFAAGGCFAAMCFWGGIYPLPQTALLLSVYALLIALFGKSLRPLGLLTVTGLSALGFSAPKLLAVADHMQRVPRLIESREVIGLSELLVMLTNPQQRFNWFPVRVPAYNWHEWGLYIGVVGLACLCLAILFARGVREHALKICGLLCLLLGFGKFHEFAPWTLLHNFPVFASQHVPSRFHYLMLFFLGLAFVAMLGRKIDPLLRQRRRLDLLLLIPVALYAVDLVRVNQRPFAQAFWMQAPEHIERLEPFEHRMQPPVQYQQRDWAAPMLLSMYANSGVIRCYGVDPTFVPGAIGREAPGYEGPVSLSGGPGTAELLEYSPNRARVQVRGASAGSLVVFNMNYDPSWNANGKPALDHGGVLAARVGSSDAVIEFSYFPRTFWLSLPIFALTLAITFLNGRGLWGSVRARVRAAVRVGHWRPPPKSHDA